MFEFQGKEYKSKASVVREFYDNGQTSLAAQDKKKLAEALDMTVQTVHATIMKHIGKASKPQTKKKINVAVTQTTNRIKQKTGRVRSGNGPIFINDKKPDVQAELRKDPNRIAVTWAPNQWGIPVCNPPIEVIDENYDPEWTYNPDAESVERVWE